MSLEETLRRCFRKIRAKVSEGELREDSYPFIAPISTTQDEVL